MDYHRGELKTPRVIKRLSQNYPATIKANLSGAHAFHQEYKEDHHDILIY
jgi:imidazolonepropionase